MVIDRDLLIHQFVTDLLRRRRHLLCYFNFRLSELIIVLLNWQFKPSIVFLHRQIHNGAAVGPRSFFFWVRDTGVTCQPQDKKFFASQCFINQKISTTTQQTMSMNAIVINKHGDVDVLEKVTLPKPTPQPRDLIVQSTSQT